jgi:hypothetical protein
MTLSQIDRFMCEWQQHLEAQGYVDIICHLKAGRYNGNMRTVDEFSPLATAANKHVVPKSFTVTLTFIQEDTA